MGKTSLAGVLANEMGVNIKLTSGPAIERAGDLAAVLTNVQKDDVLFIDEIHRLNRAVEEVLYPAMEDFALDIMVGKGPSARNLRLNLAKFTVIGATTRVALLTSPLRDRFGSTHRMEFYSPDALYDIVVRSARILGVEATPEGAHEIARRARGTPRIVNRLLRRVRDYAQVVGGGVITLEIARRARGTPRIAGRLLKRVRDFAHVAGTPAIDRKVADEALQALEVDAIEDVYEPFLIQLGFVQRTPRGRIATRRAYEHLGIPYAEKTQPENGPEQGRFWS